jgi:hypothetical protein
MKKVEYKGWPNCIKLSNGQIELIATTDVGPRIIYLGFNGGQNLFKEYPDQVGKSGGKEWNIYGGHRLWHAPEGKPRTYGLDNSPIQADWADNKLTLTQPTEETTGIQKTIEVTLSATDNTVSVRHLLTNKNLWDVKLAVWCLSVMAQGGHAILPQEPYKAHTDWLLPARPLVLWHYTNMADPRFTWGTRFVQIQQDPKAEAPQKIGILNAQGWLAYQLGDDLFVKQFPIFDGEEYPDYGVNNEVFTNADMLEAESLSPLREIAPEATTDFTETWSLFKKNVGTDEKDIEANLLPLLKK